MKPAKPQAAIEERPKQEVTKDLLGDLMAAAKTFYADCPDRWFADQHFIKHRVVTWPAAWLNSRGVTLPPERYKAIMLGIFETIKQHGMTEAVRYWPGYLLKCVQSHFKIHEDEIYNEAKAMRNRTEAAMRVCQGALKASKSVDQVSAMAEVHKALVGAHRRKAADRPSGKQMSLF
jgi:hypothetical protein